MWRPGGSRSVLAALAAGWDALTADFAEHYGLRLAVVVDEYAVHELRALIVGLPAGSRYATLTEPAGEAVAWDYAQENAARTVDAVRSLAQHLWSAFVATENDRRRAAGQPPVEVPVFPYAARPASVRAALFPDLDAAGDLDDLDVDERGLHRIDLAELLAIT